MKTEDLAQPEQEPVAWLYFHNRAEPQLDVQLEEPDCIKSFPDDVVWKKPLYTTPPQRTAAKGEDTRRAWVGLSQEDFLEACQIAERGNYLVAFQRIQAKLKEKNT